MAYVTRSGRQTKNANYSETKRRSPAKKRVLEVESMSSSDDDSSSDASDSSLGSVKPVDRRELREAFVARAALNYSIKTWKALQDYSGAMVAANRSHMREFTASSPRKVSNKRKRDNKLKTQSKNKHASPVPRKKHKTTSSKARSVKRVSSPRSKQKVKQTGKMTSEDEGRIYTIRRAATAWVLFRGQTSRQLTNSHPDLSGAQRTRKTSTMWKTMSSKQRDKWRDKADAEKAQQAKLEKEFKKHHDITKVPKEWRKIDKKAEQERSHSSESE